MQRECNFSLATLVTNLRDGGNGEADAHVEHLEDGLALHAPDRHDESDDGERVDGELLAQGVHAFLQWSP